MGSHHHPANDGLSWYMTNKLNSKNSSNDDGDGCVLSLIAYRGMSQANQAGLPSRSVRSFR